MKTSSSYPEGKRLPAMLMFLTRSPFTDEFKHDELSFSASTYSENRGLNLDNDGNPLYLLALKTPPTSCQTPGKVIPSGYTRSGKWKPGGWKPAKTDKRAGK